MTTKRCTMPVAAMLLAGILGVTACNTERETPEPDAAAAGSTAGSGTGSDTASQGDCAPELDDPLRAWAEAGFSGSVALSTGGTFDCLAAYGLADQADETPNTVDTVFSIGSVSKAFTAAAINHLVDEAKLTLDDRAGDLVPDLTGPVAGATVEQLLLHTSGLTGSHGEDHRPLDRDAAVAAISGLELDFPPGSDFLYSNAGYTLLALIVEQVSGTGYRDYMASQILTLPDGHVAGGFWDGEPAAPGPRAAGYHDDGPSDQRGDFEGPHWALHGNGDLAMTMRDLATWTRALFTGQVVSAASTEALATPGFDTGDGPGESPGWGVYDAELLGEPALASAGGGGDIGHEVVVVWLPESERAIAIASNTAEVTAEGLLQEIGPALVAGDPLPGPAEAPDGADRAGGDDSGGTAADPAELDAVTGTYELATGGSFEVTATDGGLEVSARGADAVAALFPPSDGFTADDVVAHEELVQALLRGETAAGREERAALEDDLGPIEGVELGGTVVRNGELRTYVTVTSGGESHLLWYVLDEAGGVGAVEAPTDPPLLRIVPSDGGAYRPDDPTGSGPDVTVTFEGDGMTVTGPAGTTEAR